MTPEKKEAVEGWGGVVVFFPVLIKQDRKEASQRGAVNATDCCQNHYGSIVPPILTVISPPLSPAP